MKISIGLFYKMWIDLKKIKLNINTKEAKTEKANKNQIKISNVEFPRGLSWFLHMVSLEFHESSKKTKAFIIQIKKKYMVSFSTIMTAIFFFPLRKHSD